MASVPCHVWSLQLIRAVTGHRTFCSFYLEKKKKKSLKPTDPARGADGKFPPSPAAPGFGSALAGGFEDAETQQSGIRHRSAATQALTWDRSAEGSRR